MNFYQTCPTSATSADSRAAYAQDALPPDFDPTRFPIIAAHFGGINPRAQPRTCIHIPVDRLIARPIRPDEVPHVRRVWWRLASIGHRLPPEPKQIEGGKRH